MHTFQRDVYGLFNVQEWILWASFFLDQFLWNSFLLFCLNTIPLNFGETSIYGRFVFESFSELLSLLFDGNWENLEYYFGEILWAPTSILQIFMTLYVRPILPWIRDHVTPLHNIWPHSYVLVPYMSDPCLAISTCFRSIHVYVKISSK